MYKKCKLTGNTNDLIDSLGTSILKLIFEIELIFKEKLKIFKNLTLHFCFYHVRWKKSAKNIFVLIHLLLSTQY